ncbi:MULTISPECIES: ABC transporter permease [Clostridium]|uniref:ABC transporter permease n=1 Tax=Clostridium faecium TaxID=2762223 RepID=A0ABR8YX52_9CLOT|nr:MULTISPECIES: ABC transporter permease [Clostridium]MBD8048861.1 ABC transporter permease [Clostridium faecium]MDU1347876.1 ABC transporter permease [Clostridium argentinense]
MAELSKDKFQIIGCDTARSNEILRPSMTYWQDAWRRLKQNKVAILSLCILIIITIMAIIGPALGKAISGVGYEVTNNDLLNQGPNAKNWFGTDMLGRDTFGRVWQGARVSLTIGFIGAIIDAVLGSIYGGISGFFGGIVDDIMMRILEILVSIPYLVIVILITMLFDNKGIGALVIAMTVTGWCYMARLVRGQLLQIKEQEYVLAAKALGASPSRIIVRHLLPNTLGVMIVAITFDIPGFIFGEAFLSYIGLGIQSPKTSLGALASAAQQNLIFYPEQLLFPALVISLIMLSFQLLGDGLRDALDPKLRQ